MNKYSVTKMTMNQGGNIKAYADVVVNECAVVKGVKVVSSEKGLFVSMPSYCNDKGEFRDQIFPVTAEDREALNKSVLDSYEERKVDLVQAENKTSDISARIFLNNRGDSNILATANVTIGDGLAVNGIRIMQPNNSNKEPFISYPAYQKKDGSYAQLFHPITAKMREDINSTVMQEFDKSLENAQEALKDVAQEKENSKNKTKTAKKDVGLDI